MSIKSCWATITKPAATVTSSCLVSDTPLLDLVPNNVPTLWTYDDLTFHLTTALPYQKLKMYWLNLTYIRGQDEVPCTFILGHQRKSHVTKSVADFVLTFKHVNVCEGLCISATAIVFLEQLTTAISFGSYMCSVVNLWVRWSQGEYWSVYLGLQNPRLNNEHCIFSFEGLDL